jgi:hypothetical protein
MIGMQMCFLSTVSGYSFDEYYTLMIIAYKVIKEDINRIILN